MAWRTLNVMIYFLSHEVTATWRMCDVSVRDGAANENVVCERVGDCWG